MNCASPTAQVFSYSSTSFFIVTRSLQVLQATMFPASSNLWSVQGQQVVQVFDSQHVGMTSDFAARLLLQNYLNGAEDCCNKTCIAALLDLDWPVCIVK